MASDEDRLLAQLRELRDVLQFRRESGQPLNALEAAALHNLVVTLKRLEADLIVPPECC